jgi:hypothetical protein
MNVRLPALARAKLSDLERAADDAAALANRTYQTLQGIEKQVATRLGAASQCRPLPIQWVPERYRSLSATLLCRDPAARFRPGCRPQRRGPRHTPERGPLPEPPLGGRWPYRPLESVRETFRRNDV